jgi:hypothetical protein
VRPVEHARDALARLAAGEAFGKVVLVRDEGEALA